MAAMDLGLRITGHPSSDGAAREAYGRILQALGSKLRGIFGDHGTAGQLTRKLAVHHVSQAEAACLRGLGAGASL